MKKIFVIVLLLMCITCVMAQSEQKSDIRKQIEAEKVSFITLKLDLSPEEAQLFWPLYNQMQKKKDDLENKMRSIHKSCRNSRENNCSDKMILNKCDSILLCEKAFVDLKIEYFNKFKTFLPASKVHSFLSIEKDFNRKLLKKLARIRSHGTKR